jgi:polar amino acid transport system permease protein
VISPARERWTRLVVTLAILGGLAWFLTHAPGYAYDWRHVWLETQTPSRLLHGLVTTAWVSAAAMLLALGLGFVGGLARLSRRPAVHQVGTLYVEIVRGSPLMVLLVVAYWCVAPGLRNLLEAAGAPSGISALFDSGVFVGVLTLALFAGAYVTEIVRASVESVDRGQTEAALSQGMSRRQVFWLVLLPQARRRMIPPLTGEFISLIKDSSLLGAITVLELTKAGEQERSASHRAFEILIPVALMYLVLTFSLSRLARWLELRQRA